MNPEELPPHSIVLDKLEAAGDALSDQLGGGSKHKYARFLIAALSSIPWIGGVIAASASLSASIGLALLADDSAGAEIADQISEKVCLGGVPLAASRRECYPISGLELSLDVCKSL